MIDRKFVSCGIQTDFIYDINLDENNKKSILSIRSNVQLSSPKNLKYILYINKNNKINKNNNNLINNNNNDNIIYNNNNDNNNNDDSNKTIKLKKRIFKKFEYNLNDNINIIDGKTISQKKLIMPKIEQKVKFPINTFGVNSIFQKYKNTSNNINFSNNNINNNNNNLIHQNNLGNSNKSLKLIDKIRIRKNKSLNSFEKIITKNNGSFLFIGFKEELSKSNLYKSRSFRGNIKKKFSKNKNLMSNQNCFFTFKNNQIQEC